MHEPNQPKKNTGLRRIVLAGGYSSQGLASAFRGEAAFRQEVWAFLVLAPLGLWLGDSGVERALLVGSLLLVLIAEMINTAVESVVDRVGLEKHVLAGQAKDQGSAAVLLALILAVVVWILVLTG
ncbi:MAG: diacylglycerol kinase [Thiotrichales bacterium]